MICTSWKLITIVVGFATLALYSNHNTRAIIRVMESGRNPRTRHVDPSEDER